MTLLFALTFLFALAYALMAVALFWPESRLRYLTPVMVAMSFVVAYIGLDQVSGSAKIHHGIPGWTYPSLEGEGVTVLGGAPFGDDGAYLMIQEDGKAPQLLRFKLSKEQQQAMKQAMKKQAAANNGNPWGFKMSQPKDGSGSGRSTDGQEGQAGPAMDRSLEDRESLYKFDPPQPKSGPEKDAQN